MNRINKAKKVFVAMSGGVDSSVAALLLKNKGYEVIGVFMRCFSAYGGSAFGGNAQCVVEKDAEDARRVAEKLKIPFYVWDFEEEYKKKVVDYMVSGYRKGITPNPDVMCNREIKFGLFLEKALAMKADFVATGHYVRLSSSTNSEFNANKRIKNKFVNSKQIRYSLMVAKDKNKDQSYFLWTLTQEQLKYCIFPIGGYLKSEVRDIARKAGLATATKKDSQGICFLGKVSLGDFLKEYIPEKPGKVLSLSGEKIGEHKGSYFYTIGQRHGLGLDSRHSVSGSKETHPFYVADKNVKQNTITVAEGEDNTALYKKEVELNNVNFINPEHSNILENVGVSGLKVYARVRYRQPLSAAFLKFTTSGVVNLVFEKPQKFVAPGQSAVFYSKNGGLPAGRQVLGGGVIK